MALLMTIFIFMFVVTERQFNRLAVKLRSPTEKKMKIEVAPWIQDYVTEMDDLYTDLTLEKIDDRLIGGTDRKLSSYKEIFDETERKINETKGKGRKLLPCLNPEDESDSDSEGERILLKGDPGMGKTTVSKKSAYDWATGILKVFTIVFFVFLKLVKPGDSMENIIIQQTPVLDSLRVKQSELESIFDKFGSRCLLILDGLDEHADGYNDDVLKIIKGQKFRRCHVLVTSRPHSTRDLESYFKNIVRVNGFSRNEAEKFAFKILKSKRLVRQVLAYNPGDFMEKIALNNCPILLSFMCLLVREGQINLSDDEINTGEVYTRMVRCLFKKFIIRRKKKFQNVAFTKAIMKVGKIAFRTLLTGNPLLKRSDVIEEVGPDAFDYGLLIGHEDAHRLIQDETADIFVTFPHRSLQEFLGAFYFVQALDKGESIDSLFGNTKPLFMTNPLFLYFCLWFVKHSGAYFNFENLENVHHIIEGHILKIINIPNLDLRSVATKFPAIDIEQIIKKNDKAASILVGDILSKCQNVRMLMLKSSDSIDWLLWPMRQILPSIRYITVGDICIMRRVHDILVIEIRYDDAFESQIPGLRDARVAINTLLNHVGFLGSDLSIYIEHSSGPLQLLAEINCTNIKNIHIQQRPTEKLVTNLKAMPLFVNLQRLSFNSIDFLTYEILSLSEVSRVGNLPCVTDLSFTNCKFVQTKLSLLFSSPWSRLTHLGLCKCGLNVEDYEMIGNIQDDRLPKLLSLSIDDKFSVMPHFNKRLPTLQSFYFHLAVDNLRRLSIPSITYECLPGCPESLALLNCVDSLQMLSDNLFRNDLKHLNISRNKRIIGTLSVLMCDIFPSLVALILRDCCLSAIDLSSLAQANVEGRLPKLNHLDISNNDLRKTESTNSLFAFSCKWNQLLSLNIMNTRFSPDELHRRVQSGCLSSLQELRISYYPHQPVDIVWPHLQILGTRQPSKQLLARIEDAVRQDKFPTLHSICFDHDTSDRGFSLHMFGAFHRLIEAKILCHRRIILAGRWADACPCRSAPQI